MASHWRLGSGGYAGHQLPGPDLVARALAGGLHDSAASGMLSLGHLVLFMTLCIALSGCSAVIVPGLHEMPVSADGLALAGHCPECGHGYSRMALKLAWCSAYRLSAQRESGPDR
jgi:hypothetical protein